LVIFITVWYCYLEPRLKDDVLVFSILSGLFSLGTVWAVRGLFHKENEKALDRALQGRPLEDGQWAAELFSELKEELEQLKKVLSQFQEKGSAYGAA